VKFSRKVMMSAAAFVLPLGLLSFVGVELLGSSSAAAVTVANGTINCTTLKGTVSFKPPLETTSDTTKDTTTIKATLSACHYTSTNIGTGTVTGTVTSTHIGTNNACSGLATPSSQKLKVVWKDSNGTALAPTTTLFSGYDPLVNGSGSTAIVGFDLPQDTGGTASVSAGGSFAGTDSGASSESNAWANQNAGAISAACGNATTDGLKSLTIGHAGTVADPSHAFSG
jgi:hypothetical protein